MPAAPRWSFWMAPQDHRVWRRLLPRYRAWLTPMGRSLILAALAGVVLSASGTTAAAFLVPCFTLAAITAAWAGAFFFRPTLELRRELPAPPSVGERLTYRVVARNLGRRPILDLAILEATLPFGLYAVPEAEGGLARIERLEPGEEKSVLLTLRCGARGIYELKAARAGSAYPSGLVRWPVYAGGGDRLIVLPRFTPQPEFELPVGRRYQPGGVSVSASVGDSTEFLGTREYREGDRLRDVHWASLARTGRLIVKEYREEYFVRVGLVLDTHLAPRDNPESLEKRISLAAGIADALARRDFILDILAAGETLHHFQAGRAIARLENVLELLAAIEPAERVDMAAVETALVPFAARLSSVVLLLGGWDEPRERLCRVLREAGTGVRALVVGEKAIGLPPEAAQVPLDAERIR